MILLYSIVYLNSYYERLLRFLLVKLNLINIKPLPLDVARGIFHIWSIRKLGIYNKYPCCNTTHRMLQQDGATLDCWHIQDVLVLMLRTEVH